VCSFLEVVVHECRQGGVACCWNWSEAGHVLAEFCEHVARSIGLVVGVSRSPSILRASPYMSSATDACMSSLNAVRIPRRTRGSASVQWSCAWHMITALSVRWKRSTSPLAAGWWAVVARAECRTVWPGSGRVAIQIDVPGRW
jgi:hypothetical protein